LVAVDHSKLGNCLRSLGRRMKLKQVRFMDIGLTVISAALIAFEFFSQKSHRYKRPPPPNAPSKASVLPDGCAAVRIALILNNISMCKG
jgi:hypothetical protein